MKKTLVLLLLVVFQSLLAQKPQEKKITSKVKEVTVFLKGAQITRYKTVSIPKGVSMLKFINLSPFVNAKTVQANASGNVMILSVNYQLNYLKKKKLPQVLVDLQKKYDDLNDKFIIENTNLKVINAEIDFLNQNRQIGGKSETLNATTLKSVVDYYSSTMRDLRFKAFAIKKKMDKIEEEQEKIEKEFEKHSSKKVYPTGEVWVKVEAKNPTTAKFKLTYNVKNAGWFPSYDIRANKLSDPLKIVYKANVKQDTKVDWTKVKLSFSSANPNTSGEIPKLIPYKLGYYTKPPVYKARTNEVIGTVTEASTGDPLPGANIVVKGTSIGTTTDFDGHYAINIPNSANPVLEYSYLGYKTEKRNVYSGQMNVTLQESGDALDTVVVNALGVKEDNGLDTDGYRKGRSVRKALSEKVPGIKTDVQEMESIAIPIQRVEKQTSINFSINKPYTVLSNNQAEAVPMEELNIPANYQYISVPKVNKDAFLVSYITDWEKYNFLSGQANVFVEGTSIGKTLLDTGFATDTLQVALGVDKGITVQRVSGKDYTGKKLIGTKKTDKREWIITVKNNKNQAVNLQLFDQVPVSVTDEIEVEVTRKSGGKLNENTGEIVWDLHLAPGEKKEIILRYQAKYSRYRSLILE